MCKITNDLVKSPSAQWAKGAMEDKLRRQHIRVLSALRRTDGSLPAPQMRCTAVGYGSLVACVSWTPRSPRGLFCICLPPSSPTK